MTAMKRTISLFTSLLVFITIMTSVCACTDDIDLDKIFDFNIVWTLESYKLDDKEQLVDYSFYIHSTGENFLEWREGDRHYQGYYEYNRGELSCYYKLRLDDTPELISVFKIKKHTSEKLVLKKTYGSHKGVYTLKSELPIIYE